MMKLVVKYPYYVVCITGKRGKMLIKNTNMFGRDYNYIHEIPVEEIFKINATL